MKNKFEFAKTMINQAADYLKVHQQGQLDVHVKSKADDLVTNLDKEIQNFLIEAIHERYPDDHILAEEDNVRHDITDGSVWVLDPIDGTLNFVVQKDNYAIMVAYYENGHGQFGLIYDVVQDLLLAGGGQFPITVNDRSVEPLQEVNLERSLVACNAGLLLANDHNIQAFINQTLGVRIYGSAGISMMRVMRQQLLAYFSYIQPWDYAAAKILGEALGYQTLTIDGQEPDFMSPQKIMFVPKSLVPAILAITQKGEQ
ncbi:inositol monophosphatase family protein [Streptococcus halichoeri]|uniref:inositol monophosphatase family protein n=1 Tax=Streptococcus halichoeri TaxID=254785 RepID=UPI00135B6AC2|nr:inositol monophosphatase family protein [Streptococcus halichoeri]